MVLALTIFGLVATAAGCVVFSMYDPLRQQTQKYLQQKTTWASQELDEMFVDVTMKRLRFSFIIGPVAGAAIGFAVLSNVIGATVGGVIGLLIPQLYIRQMKSKRHKQFQKQLVDSLMLMSSSLKAGLSILQGFEVIAEEMPAPMGQEIGLVVKENRMGVSFAESLYRLKQRMPSDDVDLVVTAILVARESGGDVTRVFSQLVETIRERYKLKERVTTLTIQSRMQGILMSCLPVVFAAFVYSTNPQFFDVFIADPFGKMLLMLAVVLEVVGAFLIWLFSRSPI